MSDTSWMDSAVDALGDAVYGPAWTATQSPLCRSVPLRNDIRRMLTQIEPYVVPREDYAKARGHWAMCLKNWRRVRDERDRLREGIKSLIARHQNEYTNHQCVSPHELRDLIREDAE